MKIDLDVLAGKIMGWCLIISLMLAVGGICVGGVVSIFDMVQDRIVEAFND